MSLVDIAVSRPYTFIVMGLAILLATPLVLRSMPVDVYPDVRIPVISIVWTYSGLSAQEIGARITAGNERILTTTVSDIEHTESQSLAGVSVIKVFFQPHANLQTALAQVVAIEQTQLKQLPGITAPFIIQYSASSVPVLQLGLSSPSLPEEGVLDAAGTFLRPQLVSIPGVAIPFPYGGKISQINVDLDTEALQAKGLTPADVVNAISAQNLVLPGGTMKMGESETTVAVDSSFDNIAALNALPVRSGGGATVKLAEVGHVRDGYAPQTNVARQDGRHGAIMAILKNGAFSTLDIVAALRAALPAAAESLPRDFVITPLFDQSLFARAAIAGVLREGLIAAALTAALVLLFLGNWRSTAIIAVSIPLSVCGAIVLLHALGETLNIMTLGGLALAVGMLVDDATVTIENIERHRHAGRPFLLALREGANEVATPALVSTLSICIVFAPMFFLGGVARYLLVPLAEAVVLAMLVSYLLSRTLVPTLLLLAGAPAAAGTGRGRLAALQRRFDAGFEELRGGYLLLLSHVLARRRRCGAIFLGFCLLSLALYPLLGRDFFPAVDGGQIRLHMRMPSGSRIEATERMAERVEQAVRATIPAAELETILDNLGVSNSNINLAYSNAGTIGPIDAEILIALRPGHGPSAGYVARLRRDLPRQFPGLEFFFQPADMMAQILNFGVPATIDVQFSGQDTRGNLQLAGALLKQVQAIPGVVDAHLHQRLDQPGLRLGMDRTRLQQLGIAPADVAQNVLVSLAGTSQTAPAYWLKPDNGVVYSIVVQTPQYRMNNVDSLMRTPVRGAAGDTQLLGNLVAVTPERGATVVSRYNGRPVVDLYLNVAGRDLGGVAADVERAIAAQAPQLPRGAKVALRGQVQSMNGAFGGLLAGLAAAVVLIYLLIVINFQSWLDALIIVLALPAALAGIAWMLLLTATTLSVPALTGAVMSMGVATANSILVVAFARQRLAAGATALAAALAAGRTRLRPVLMTALAMVIGMLPMALGLDEGSQQNAPLGRAVIGGLLLATVSTLFFVPLLFASLHRRPRHHYLATSGAPT